MKFFIAFAALVALTVAVPLGKPVNSDLEHLEAIIAAINSPSTDPATAAALEEQLAGIINAMNPIAVGPAIIPEETVIQPEPISVGPALIPPKPDGGAVVGPIEPAPVVVAPVVPSPVVVGDIPSGTSPLVQIIVNVIKATLEAVPVKPISRPEPVGEIVPTPVHVVDVAPEPVHVVEVAPEPVQVVEVAPEPVQVVEVAPEPVQIGVPVLPEAAVVLPEQLN